MTEILARRNSLSRTIVRDPENSSAVAAAFPRLASAIELPAPADADREPEDTIAAARVEAVGAASLGAAGSSRSDPSRGGKAADGLRAAASQAGEREAREAWERQRWQLDDLVLSVGAAYKRFCLATRYRPSRNWRPSPPSGCWGAVEGRAGAGGPDRPRRYGAGLRFDAHSP